MRRRQPILETTPHSPRESFHCEVVSGRSYGARWHFHPEHQITLVLRSRGYRVVGDRVAPLSAGDLVVVGSNLPHVWHQDESPGRGSGGVRAIVVRFREDFLGEHFLQKPEMAPVLRLLRRAARGLQVTGRTRVQASARMQQLAGATGLGRVLILLALLEGLSRSRELRPIASAGFAPSLRDADPPRMQRVMRFIQERLERSIEREEVARCAGLSPGAFSRFFRTRIGKTLPQYVNELRIGRACSRLAESDDKIADVALDAGYGNLAHFNRQFRQVTGTTPKAYRRAFETPVQ